MAPVLTEIKTVRQLCVPLPGALSITVADQVEQLDELIRQEGNGEEFFRKTFVTEGMRELLSRGFSRLAGKSSGAIFHLKQAMGGGKTHLLVAFGLLARNRDLRREQCSGYSWIEDFDEAKIAAFNGRNQPDEFFWGEIARQLGKEHLFAQYWQSGPRAPDERAWLELFEGGEPTLILLDEMPPYFEYYQAITAGSGTVADIAARAFANLLSATGKTKNVCVVISDLSGTYSRGGKLINDALNNARNELGRQEVTITPVDLTTAEVYDILRKRLFERLPSEEEIEQVATAFGNSLVEAVKSKSIGSGALSLADEIPSTYPFHPRLKNIVALFKNNEQFKQTRGLLELVSRLMKSVWESPEDNVYLMGAQHFDLGIHDVREKLAEISNMRDVISKDIWDDSYSANAQRIVAEEGADTAMRVAVLLFTSSLSTAAANTVRGLTTEDLLECALEPGKEAGQFLAALDKLQNEAWYLHQDSSGRFYFNRQENLTKLLQEYATSAPQPQIDGLIRNELKMMFAPKRKVAYSDALPLPTVEEAAEALRTGRVLLIMNPTEHIPPESIESLFQSLSKKNNLLVLTGQSSAFANVETAARKVYAARKAQENREIDRLQQQELEDRKKGYEMDFLSTLRSLFSTVIYPVQRADREPELKTKQLDPTRSNNDQFDGEEQIEKTLTSDPIKLICEVSEQFGDVRSKAERLLWAGNEDEVRWSEALERAQQLPGMYWLPARGLEDLKARAISEGLWEDLGNGYVTKKPKKKTTSAQVTREGNADDTGKVRLRVTPSNAGAHPQIFYQEDGPVTESSPRLTGNQLETRALRVQFLVKDPNGQHETGPPVTWSNELKIRCNLVSEKSPRKLELMVAPRGVIRYTLDGSEPRNSGKEYNGPIDLPDTAVTVLAYAEAEGIEARQTFPFPEVGGKVRPDAAKPGAIQRQNYFKIDNRRDTFAAINFLKERRGSLSRVSLSLGQGEAFCSIDFGKLSVDPQVLDRMLESVAELFPADAPLTMNFERAQFQNGHDIEQFCRQLRIELQPGELIQGESLENAGGAAS